MILPDSKIEGMLGAGEIVIEPNIDKETQLQPASVDLHLSNEFKSIDVGAELDMNEGIEQKDTSEFYVDDSYTLEPGEFVLASTEERVEIPNGYVCRVEGRSSIGRLAVDVHATAGYVDPGFNGRITLEISNKNRYNPVILRPGRRFVQLVFEKTDGKSKRDYGEKDGKYQNQNSPVASRIEEDIDNE